MRFFEIFFSVALFSAGCTGATAPAPVAHDTDALSAIVTGSPEEGGAEMEAFDAPAFTEPDTASAPLELDRVRALDSIPKGYYLQMVATTDPVEADLRVEELIGAGFEAQVQRANIYGKKWYRVLVGPFATSDRAAAEGEAIREAGLLREKPFVQRF